MKTLNNLEMEGHLKGDIFSWKGSGVSARLQHKIFKPLHKNLVNSTVNWHQIRVKGIQEGLGLVCLWEHNESKLMMHSTLPPPPIFSL